MTDRGSSALSTSGLTKRFGSLTAVDGVSLSVREGEIYAFLGLNGAGKTTTIRMLLGMIRPSGGEATLLGIPLRSAGADLWSRVGFLVETPNAYPELTVRENLEIARRLYGVTTPGAVPRIIDRLGLGPVADRRARTLSLGTAQRLGLARAFFHAPRLLILDEPANGLDPGGVVEVRDMLKQLALNDGVTVFLSSHILGEVARLATRIGIIHHGRLLEELDAGILEQKRRRRLLVDARDRVTALRVLRAGGFSPKGRSGDAIVLTSAEAIDHPETISGLLSRKGVPPTKVLVEQEDLETYFLRLVGQTPGDNA